MQLLIDGDLVAYRCAASVGEDGLEETAIWRCNNLIQELLHTTGAETYQCFLTGYDNFRKEINKEYKANRKDTIPPKWLQHCRKFLIETWNAEISSGCEADDLLGMAQNKQDFNDEVTMIASLDKDLLMIPGYHYNWVREEREFVLPIDGLRHLYKQMLIGDRSDNIFGVVGLGKVKAAKIIDPLEDEEEMISTVFDLYKGDAERFLMNAQCLWILQNEGETWANRSIDLILPDPLRQELEAKLDFMKYLMRDISMAHITNPVKTFGIPVNGIVPDSMEISQHQLT